MASAARWKGASPSRMPAAAAGPGRRRRPPGPRSRPRTRRTASRGRLPARAARTPRRRSRRRPGRRSSAWRPGDRSCAAGRPPRRRDSPRTRAPAGRAPPRAGRRRAPGRPRPPARSAASRIATCSPGSIGPLRRGRALPMVQEGQPLVDVQRHGEGIHLGVAVHLVGDVPGLRGEVGEAGGLVVPPERQPGLGHEVGQDLLGLLGAPVRAHSGPLRLRMISHQSRKTSGSLSRKTREEDVDALEGLVTPQDRRDVSSTVPRSASTMHTTTDGMIRPGSQPPGLVHEEAPHHRPLWSPPPATSLGRSAATGALVRCPPLVSRCARAPRSPMTLPDDSRLELPDGATGHDAAAAIGPGLAKAAVAVKVGDEIRDLALPAGRRATRIADRHPARAATTTST